MKSSRFASVVLVGAVLAALSVFTPKSAEAVWRSDWTYQPADLSDSNSVQAAVDALADATGVRPGVTNAMAQNITAYTLKLKEATSQSVTNGGTYTVTNVVNQLNSSAGANGATNAITLNRPPAGTESVLLVNSGTSNKLSIASTGSWNGPAVELGSGEACFAFGVASADGAGTNAWYTLSTTVGVSTNQALLTPGTNAITLRILRGVVTTVVN